MAYRSRREEAARKPQSHASIIIDAMDQAKCIIPYSLQEFISKAHATMMPAPDSFSECTGACYMEE